MIAIEESLIESLVNNAKQSARKRVIHRLHESDTDPVHRMINALIPGTYVRPHKHENPDKVELFCILKGKVACLSFSPNGKVTNIHIISEDGPNLIVDIPAKEYHSLVALEPSAVLEIIQGPYQAQTHKNWPIWAPEEESLEAQDYLGDLHAIIRTFHTNIKP